VLFLWMMMVASHPTPNKLHSPSKESSKVGKRGHKNLPLVRSPNTLKCIPASLHRTTIFEIYSLINIYLRMPMFASCSINLNVSETWSKSEKSYWKTKERHHILVRLYNQLAYYDVIADGYPTTLALRNTREYFHLTVKMIPHS